MLSRSAAGLYWMGRYLERASHLSRLLKQQTESLVDSPPRDIYFGWHRIYGALEREPVSGALQLDSDDLFTLVDSFTLTDDLTFEPANPDSIRSCFVQGRENARQMRHHISAEMWTCLNQSYLRLQNMEIQDIWPRSPENFYAETATQIDTFRGVTSSTLYRDDAWHFVQLGNYVERLQLSSSLLMAQIAAVRLFEVPADAYWTSLLRHYHAFEAYNRASSAAIEPDRVLGLLVTNPQLPDSLSLSVSELCNELTAIGRGPDAEATARTRSQAEYLRQLVGIEWSGGIDGHALLRRIRNECRQLHHLVTKTYLDYPVLAPANGRAGRHDQ
ncbi:MAG: alpha-E domain-containing protein [Actinomycetia bacterium]|nr:alpha-E domain-containing protein [Actinomycetes bacterium]